MTDLERTSEESAAPSHGEAGVIAAILRAGVALASGLIALGLVLLLARGGAPSPPLAAPLPALVGRAAAGAARLEPASLIEFGLIVLLLTPVARVVAGLFGSLLERDWSYVLIGLAVLALVLYGALSGNAAG